MKKVSIILLIFVSLQCFGQDTILQKETDLVVKSYCKYSRDGFYYRGRMIGYIQVDRILSLKKYANEILSCYDTKTFDLGDYYIMCFFDSIPQSIVDTAFAYSNSFANLPLIFRAKYGGDTIVIENLLDKIEKYFFSENKDEISDKERKSYEYISYLFLLNSERAKNILYRIMESTKYTTHYQYGMQYYKISLSYIAIQNFLWFYPPDKPISSINPEQFKVYDGHPIFSVKDINKSEFEQYKKDVEKYIYHITNKKLKINTPFFNLGEYLIGIRYSED